MNKYSSNRFMNHKFNLLLRPNCEGRIIQEKKQEELDKHIKETIGVLLGNCG